MPVQHYNIPSSVLPKLGAAVLIAALAGCTVAGPDHPQGEIFDPYEEGNRKTHEFNRALDRALVRPAAKGYVTVVPEGIAISVGVAIAVVVAGWLSFGFGNISEASVRQDQIQRAHDHQPTQNIRHIRNIRKV